MLNFIEHFFTITINHSPISYFHSSLRHAPISSSFCQLLNSEQVKVTLRLTVSQSVSLVVEPHLGLMTRYLLLFDSYGLVF
jgi:hypothetical protein